MRRRDLNDAASAASIGLIVALVVFSAGFYFLTTTVQDPPVSTLRTAEEQNYHTVAESLSAALIATGQGWYDGAACTTQYRANTEAMAPEQVGSLTTSRFGLGEEYCSRHAATPQGFNNISFSKLADIYEAQTESDPDNGHVDYEDARRSLGLDEKGLDFHLRTWLIPSSVQEIVATGFKDQYLRPVYLGHYNGEDNRDVPHASGFVNNADSIVLYVYVTNNGEESTILGVEFTIPLSRGNIEFKLHTPLLTTGQSFNVTVTIRKTSDWSWDGEAVAWYTISDPYENLDTGTIDLSGVSMTYASQRNTQVVWSDEYYFIKSGLTASVKTNYASWDGEGRTQTWTDWTQRVYGPPLGLVVATNVLPNAKSGFLSSALATTGTFTAKLQNDLLSSIWNQDTVNVVSAAPDAFLGGPPAASPTSSVAVEANFIATLVEGFDPYVYSATYNSVAVPYASGGDVYPDVGEALEGDFMDLLTDASGAATLAEVSTVVVGSDFDHHAMNDPHGRTALASWVQAGGTVIVFGSDGQSMQWLVNLFDGSFNEMVGPLTAEDGGNPVLNVPNDLDWVAFDQDVMIDYANGDNLKFQTVISNGGAEDLLAISNNGAFGSGRVILSGWRPYALTADQSTSCATPFTITTSCQGLNLMHNALTLSYKELFIDYGPMPSGQTSTGVSLRIVSVYHPELEQTLSMGMQVIVFAQGG